MPNLKPAYLIHGDDHGAVAERRAGLRALAEGPGSDATSVELLEGESASPEGAAAALVAMTLSVGWRVIVVEGVERWREADVEQQLAAAMAEMPPETTLALFGREEAKAKTPASLHAMIKRAGGQVVAQMTVKSWELAKWARQQGSRMGLELDPAAAKALVTQVGEGTTVSVALPLTFTAEAPSNIATLKPALRSGSQDQVHQVKKSA